MLLVKWINFRSLLKPRTKRSHPRTGSNNLIRYTPDGGLQPLLSNLVNISEGGLQLSVRKRIRVGTYLNMVINLVEKDRDVPVVGKVVWVRPLAGYRGYRVGVAFQEIDPDHQETLRDLSSSPVLKKRK